MANVQVAAQPLSHAEKDRLTLTTRYVVKLTVYVDGEIRSAEVCKGTLLEHGPKSFTFLPSDITCLWRYLLEDTISVSELQALASKAMLDTFKQSK